MKYEPFSEIDRAKREARCDRLPAWMGNDDLGAAAPDVYNERGGKRTFFPRTRVSQRPRDAQERKPGLIFPRDNTDVETGSLFHLCNEFLGI